MNSMGNAETKELLYTTLGHELRCDGWSRVEGNKGRQNGGEV